MDDGGVEQCVSSNTATVRLQRHLEAAEAEGQRLRNEAWTRIISVIEYLEAKNKDLEERAQAASDHVLKVAEEIQRNREETDVLQGELGRIRKENEVLRSRQRTEKEDSLTLRLVVIAQRFTAHAMKHEGFSMEGGVRVKGTEDVEHVIEAAEHALDDYGAPALG